MNSLNQSILQNYAIHLYNVYMNILSEIPILIASEAENLYDNTFNLNIVRFNSKMFLYGKHISASRKFNNSAKIYLDKALLDNNDINYINSLQLINHASDIELTSLLTIELPIIAQNAESAFNWINSIPPSENINNILLYYGKKISESKKAYIDADKAVHFKHCNNIYY